MHPFQFLGYWNKLYNFTNKVLKYFLEKLEIYIIVFHSIITVVSISSVPMVCFFYEQYILVNPMGTELMHNVRVCMLLCIEEIMKREIN